MGIDNINNVKNLDKEVQKIHKSTRTFFPFFGFIHNFLRIRSKLYYRWHLNSKASAIHWFAVSWYTATIFFSILIFALWPVFNEVYAVAGNWSQTTFTGSDGTYTNTQPANANADATLNNPSNLSNAGGGKWLYRKPITITGSTAGAQTNYQVAVNPSIYDNTGLVGSWHFSEGSGTTTADMSGNSNNGTMNGTSYWTSSGRFGNAFNGSNIKVISCSWI